MDISRCQASSAEYGGALPPNGAAGSTAGSMSARTDLGSNAKCICDAHARGRSEKLFVASRRAF